MFVLAGLVSAPSALATHGGSHDPSPSAPNCKWYGSVEHDGQVDSAQAPGYRTTVEEEGAGWSGPSDDSTCRGTVQFSYIQHDIIPDGWFHREGEHTVSSAYEAGWANFGPPGTFTATFPGDEPVTLNYTDYAGGEGTYEAPGGTTAGCVVPGAETAAKRAKIQAVVITCSQIDEGSSPGQTLTGTIRMRRTDCDKTVDTDGDDLADCTEYSLQTEPHNPDTDGDNLTDGEEVHTHGTDPAGPGLR